MNHVLQGDAIKTAIESHRRQMPYNMAAALCPRAGHCTVPHSPCPAGGGFPCLPADIAECRQRGERCLDSKRMNKPVIIATSTIALQEQLWRDVPAVMPLLGLNRDVILAKGPTHYLCNKRADEYMCDPKADPCLLYTS